MVSKNSYIFLIFSAILFVSFTGCKEDPIEPGTPSYQIPSTYNFTNVDFSGQTQRLQQLYEMGLYMATAKVKGGKLEESRLLGMYKNDSIAAQWQGNYEASKQLKDKTQPSQQAVITKLLQALANSSSSTESAGVGQAGVAMSVDGQSTYLLNANGVEETQLILKGLMGACFYYQVAAVYLGDDKMNVNNTTVIEGKGTEMEHHWDEAFGYFGVPFDFPANTDNLLFWGSYANNRDGVIQSNSKVMDAYLKGRAAISNRDLLSRDAARKAIRKGYESIAAASAIHYLNETADLFKDTAKRAHVLSEATGFIYALQFNPDKLHSNEEIMGLISTYAGSIDLSGINFYNIELSDITAVRDTLAEWYNLTAVKEQL